MRMFAALVQQRRLGSLEGAKVIVEEREVREVNLVDSLLTALVLGRRLGASMVEALALSDALLEGTVDGDVVDGCIEASKSATTLRPLLI